MKEHHPVRAPDGVVDDGSTALFTKLPVPGAPCVTQSAPLASDETSVLGQARELRASGETERAAAVVENAIRADGWRQTRLWWELVSLVVVPQDYQRIRQLWLATPIHCRNNLSIIRAVARAACIAGHHGEGQLLLRRAILLAARRKRLQRAIPGKVKSLLKAIRNRFSGTPASSQDESFEERAAVALQDLNGALNQFGVRAFLISGTLLGYMREGGIIGWDKDIDVGVFSEECDGDIEKFFDGHPRFHVRRTDLTSDRLRVNHENGVWIDIFPHYLEKGLRWHDGTATRWWNVPFELMEVDFLGVKQYIPEDPERYLDENYGNWRVPEPNFDARLDAPNAEITDPEHFESLLYFSLLSAIQSGKSVMRDRYISLLQEKESSAWLKRI